MRTSSTQPALGTPLNRSHPLSNGLVGCWLLNEGGGLKAFDSCGFGFQNGVLNSAVFKQTKKGNAVNFNGSSSYVGIGDFDRIEPAKITVSCWFRTTTASEQFMVSKEDLDVVARRSYSLRIYDTANAKVRWVVWKEGTTGVTQGTDWQHVLSANTYADGLWHHAVGTWDGTTVKLYIDGIAEPSVSFSGAIKQTIAELEFGRSQATTTRQWFNGDLVDIKIYNRAISDTEARQLYTNSYQMFKNLGRKAATAFLNTAKFNNRGVRPRPFAPGLAR